MRNIRLYIGGERVDLGNSPIALTFQTTDATEPTAVKNSFSKTVKLPSTETNRRVFGGLWHLDSIVLNAGRGIGTQFNPMKRVEFQLFNDEMVIERGYCQLLSIERKSSEVSFNVGLFGGLGEFFYHLATTESGEWRSLADLEYSSDLGFTINASKVQEVWDNILSGALPPLAFVPMHNGVPKTIDADKALIKGGGLPSSIVDSGETYSAKNGYVLAKLNRKYTEWEMGDLRSYLQRPALRVEEFIRAVCNPNNNGGWNVELDSEFFSNENPYFSKTYILLPQLNTTEETENVCDGGYFDAVEVPTATGRQYLQPRSECLQIDGDAINLSDSASNAYLRITLPIQIVLQGLSSSYNELFMAYRYSGYTEIYGVSLQAVAYDGSNNVIATSPRYVFSNKNHKGILDNLYMPSALVATTDAVVAGRFVRSGSGYVYRSDDNNSEVFSLQLDKVPRPDGNHSIRIELICQSSMVSYSLNGSRKGVASSRVNYSYSQLVSKVLGDSNNTLTLTEPTQYASDSIVSQAALFGGMKCSPLELLLSLSKQFGLMFLQNNERKSVSILQRKNFYLPTKQDISDFVAVDRGVSVRPVRAEGNIYTLETEYPESTLSKAYIDTYGRVYGGIRLNIGYEFGGVKNLFEKSKFKGVVFGALAGAGYWRYFNGEGRLPSAISEGLKVTYYREEGGETKTKDVEYNLFNVSRVEKLSSAAMGVASKNEDGEEVGIDISPCLVFATQNRVNTDAALSDDSSAMVVLNNAPCWVWDSERSSARVPEFARVATFDGQTYSLDFGTPKESYYIPSVSLSPEQAIYSRFWERFLSDVLSRDTKVVECYVVLRPHLDIRQEMRKFYLFGNSLWVLNKVSDYDATKEQPVKCEFIRVIDIDAYLNY